jgi:hypothetical protein
MITITIMMNQSNLLEPNLANQATEDQTRTRLRRRRRRPERAKRLAKCATKMHVVRSTATELYNAFVDVVTVEMD